MKTQVEISAIGQSSSYPGQYIVILTEIFGDKRRLPIVVNEDEAFFIMNRINNPKQNKKSKTIFDFFKDITDISKIEVVEFVVSNLHDVEFECHMIFKKENEEYGEMKLPIGLILCLSIIYKVNIWVDEKVFKKAYDIIYKKDVNNSEDINAHNDINELERQIQLAIEEENYELAAKLRDQIEKIKKSN